MDTEPHLRKFQKELSAGTVALVLLAVLARAEEPLYGYQIAKQLEQRGGALAGKQSALYPVLRNLHAAGLLDSHTEPSVAGPPRRYYRITGLGRAVRSKLLSLREEDYAVAARLLRERNAKMVSEIGPISPALVARKVSKSSGNSVTMSTRTSALFSTRVVVAALVGSRLASRR